MNYFDYAKNRIGYSNDMVVRVYNAVYSLKSYAKTIYKGLWEDALDASFFHILENYDESSNNLEHYTIRVVSTILLNKYNHEIEHEVSLQTGLDKESMDAVGNTPLDILLDNKQEVSTDIEECIRYLLPMFIEDYKFFKSRKKEDRKLTYEGLFNLYSEGTILTAMDELNSLYGSDMDYLYDLKKNSHFRNYNSERYLSSMDSGIEYECQFKGIILYKKKASRLERFFYLLNIRDMVDRLIHVYKGTRCKVIGDLEVYCTLSGAMVYNEKDLRETLENELIGTILSRYDKLKVLVYEKGSSIILTSNTDRSGISLEIEEKPFEIPLKPLIAKCTGKVN